MKILNFRSVILLAFVVVSTVSAQTVVTLQGSATSPVPLGTPVTWTATVSGANAATLTYRFRVQPPGGEFRTVVDFGPKPTLTWTSIDREGTFQIEVAVSSGDTSKASVTTSAVSFSSLVSGATPKVTISAN